MQILAIEYARNVLGFSDANSLEFNPETKHPVIKIMDDQIGVDLGATMRLGAYECALQKGSKAYEAYNAETISERHRHRYEFNNDYRDTLQNAGLEIAGINPKRNLVEIVEVKGHPWMLGAQFHPEFKSKLSHPHPLFCAFIKNALKRNKNSHF